MDPAKALRLRNLLAAQQIASLGTLHRGEPYVSMVPFALLPDRTGFVIHVSRLSTHTRDMEANPAVSLMVVAQLEPDVPPQSLERVTFQGEAVPCLSSDPAWATAKQAYLERFPESSLMFGLADFALFVIRPRTARYIGGFAQAVTISAERLAEVLV